MQSLDLFIKVDSDLKYRMYRDASACDFTPLLSGTVWKSHSGIGGLGGCTMSSNRNTMS